MAKYKDYGFFTKGLEEFSANAEPDVYKIIFTEDTQDTGIYVNRASFDDFANKWMIDWLIPILIEQDIIDPLPQVISDRSLQRAINEASDYIDGLEAESQNRPQNNETYDLEEFEVTRNSDKSYGKKLVGRKAGSDVVLTEDDVLISIFNTPDDPRLIYDSFSDKRDADIIKKKRKTNSWAWTQVTVCVVWKLFDEEYNIYDDDDAYASPKTAYIGYDSLSGCSYDSKEDFVSKSGYYDGMVKTSIAMLNDRLSEIRTGKIAEDLIALKLNSSELQQLATRFPTLAPTINDYLAGETGKSIRSYKGIDDAEVIKFLNSKPMPANKKPY